MPRTAGSEGGPHMRSITISKTDAARRQILSAIRLYFENGDIPPIHTLAAAAFNVTTDLCASHPGAPDCLGAWVDELVRPAAKEMFLRKFNETANFLKHADRDPKAVHEFSPKETENLLFLAVCQYRQLTGDWSPEIRLFWTWYTMQHPDVFNTSPEVINLGKDLCGGDRNSFWRQFLPLLQAGIDRGLPEQ